MTFTQILVLLQISISQDLDKEQTVLMTHGDSIDRVADNFKVVAVSAGAGVVAAIANEKTKIYGVQFHPEVDLTRDGLRMIDNFLKGVCGLAGSFRMEDRMQRCMDYIRKTAGNSKVRTSEGLC